MSEKVKSVNHGLPISAMKWWLVQGVTPAFALRQLWSTTTNPLDHSNTRNWQRRWMEGWLSLQRLKYLIEICTGPFFISILIQRQTLFWEQTDWVALKKPHDGKLQSTWYNKAPLSVLRDWIWSRPSEPRAHCSPQMPFVTYHTLVLECHVPVQEVEAREEKIKADRD